MLWAPLLMILSVGLLVGGAVGASSEDHTIYSTIPPHNDDPSDSNNDHDDQTYDNHNRHNNIDTQTYDRYNPNSQAHISHNRNAHLDSEKLDPYASHEKIDTDNSPNQNKHGNHDNNQTHPKNMKYNIHKKEGTLDKQYNKQNKPTKPDHINHTNLDNQKKAGSPKHAHINSDINSTRTDAYNQTEAHSLQKRDLPHINPHIDSRSFDINNVRYYHENHAGDQDSYTHYGQAYVEPAIQYDPATLLNQAYRSDESSAAYYYPQYPEPPRPPPQDHSLYNTLYQQPDYNGFRTVADFLAQHLGGNGIHDKQGGILDDSATIGLAIIGLALLAQLLITAAFLSSCNNEVCTTSCNTNTPVCTTNCEPPIFDPTCTTTCTLADPTCTTTCTTTTTGRRKRDAETDGSLSSSFWHEETDRSFSSFWDADTAWDLLFNSDAATVWDLLFNSDATTARNLFSSLFGWDWDWGWGEGWAWGDIGLVKEAKEAFRDSRLSTGQLLCTMTGRFLKN